MTQKEYHRRWYKKNKKRKDAQSRAWRKNNAKRARFLSRRWYLKNRKRHIRQTIKNAQKRLLNPAARKKRHSDNSLRWKLKTETQRKLAARRVKQWRLAHPRRQRASMIKCLYGVEAKEISAIRKHQGNRCAICRKRFRKTPHVDHDHDTKRVRGLLCGTCNIGLGMFKDSDEFLIYAANYIKEARCPQ